MITDILCNGLAIAAGQTSAGMRVDLASLGASGDFGMEVSSDNACTISYKASSGGVTPIAVDGNGVLAAHAGGAKMYWPDIMPAAKIWVYVTAGSSPVVVSVTLNVW